MRIAIAQIDPVVGAFDENFRKIREAYERACLMQARFLLTPELSVCGYPLNDWIERPEVFQRCDQILMQAAALTVGRSCALFVGHVLANPSDRGRAAQNAVSVFENGKLVFRQLKTLLPTYDVFDEARYFEPAESIQLWECDGKKVGVAICEDLWGRDPSMGRQIYGRNPLDPIEQLSRLKPELVVSLSASPFERGKRTKREGLHGDVARSLGAPLIYVNQTGATDEVLFDGGSFVAHRDGAVAGRLKTFEPSFGLVSVDFSSGKATFEAPALADREDTSPEELETLTRALVTGIREYFKRTGFSTAVLGLSGGIDSAVVAVLTVLALGSRNVLGVAMPSQYSSSHSREDAEQLASNLGIPFEVRPIKFLNSASIRELIDHGKLGQLPQLAPATGGSLAPIALENLQARLRGLVLMTLSNHYSALVLTTGNKSELATGYGTLYGDMCGALAPIGDLYKTQVYELARYLNQRHVAVIPERSITKAPSAELRPDQKDQDSLPPYDLLDALLEDYLERLISIEDLEKKYGAKLDNPGWLREILHRVELNEFKRRQSAPVLKVSSKAFGMGRRIPVAKTVERPQNEKPGTSETKGDSNES